MHTTINPVLLATVAVATLIFTLVILDYFQNKD